MAYKEVSRVDVILALKCDCNNPIPPRCASKPESPACIPDGLAQSFQFLGLFHVRRLSKSVSITFTVSTQMRPFLAGGSFPAWRFHLFMHRIQELRLRAELGTVSARSGHGLGTVINDN